MSITKENLTAKIKQLGVLRAQISEKLQHFQQQAQQAQGQLVQINANINCYSGLIQEMVKGEAPEAPTEETKQPVEASANGQPETPPQS